MQKIKICIIGSQNFLNFKCAMIILASANLYFPTTSAATAVYCLDYSEYVQAYREFIAVVSRVQFVIWSCSVFNSR
jgi:hypothetical protein